MRKREKGIYFIYYLVDAGNIVYIGCSSNIYKRFKEHKYQKQFDTIEMFSMPDQRTAKNKEKQLIVKHKPIHNGNAKYTDKAVILQADKMRKTSINQLKKIHSILSR